MLNLFVRLQTALVSLRERQEGQTMAEYGVVLTVITVGIITALTVFSGAIERSILRVVELVP